MLAAICDMPTHSLWTVAISGTWIRSRMCRGRIRITDLSKGNTLYSKMRLIKAKYVKIKLPHLRLVQSECYLFPFT